MSSRTPGRVLATLATIMLVAAGCSDPDSPREASVTARPASGKPVVKGSRVDVAIRADGVHPSGERVEVRAGAPLTLVIRATAPGELHVHSSPEQHVDYPRGLSTATLRIDQPGIVDVESHQLDKLVVQLEVR